MTPRTFGRKQVPPRPGGIAREHIAEAVAEQRPENPLIAAQLGSDELLHRLCGVLDKGRGVHMETLLTIVGSLAGFSCIAALMRMLNETGETPGSPEIVVFLGKQGER